MPHAIARAFAPALDGHLPKLKASPLTHLKASELHEPTVPVSKPDRATMRACSSNAPTAGGTEAAEYLLVRIRAADPAKADVREAILDTAWAGLTGWR